MTGDLTVDEDFNTLSEEDLQKGELFFGAPAALIVLLLVFGAVVAGVIPLVLAILSIVVALALTAIVAQAFDLSVFVTNMIFGMGLALGIDYSSSSSQPLPRGARAGSGEAGRDRDGGRDRQPRRALQRGCVRARDDRPRARPEHDHAQPRHRRDPRRHRLGRRGADAAPGRDQPAGRPHRLDARSLSSAAPTAGTESRFWGRIVRAVMRRPVVSLVAAVALLLALRVPVLSLKTGTAGISTLPDRFESKQGFLLLERGVPAGRRSTRCGSSSRATPPRRAAGGRHAPRERARRARRSSGRRGRRRARTARSSSSPSRSPATPSHAAAVAAVRELRADVVPAAFEGSGAEVFVGGRDGGGHRLLRRHGRLAPDRVRVRARASASSC